MTLSDELVPLGMELTATLDRYGLTLEQVLPLADAALLDCGRAYGLTADEQQEALNEMRQLLRLFVAHAKALR